MRVVPLVSFLTLAENVVSAFAPAPEHRRTFIISSSMPTHLRSTEPKPLEEEGGDAAEPEGGEDAEPMKAVYRNLGRGGDAEEVKWVDPAMSANTNPFELDLWAYPLVGIPLVLLLNDAFHFIPKEGPLSFLNNF